MNPSRHEAQSLPRDPPVLSNPGEAVAGAAAETSPCGGHARALILSGSIGHGHASVAAACSAALSGTALSADRSDVPVVDCIELLGPVRSRLARGLFRTALSFPAFYDGFHFSQLRAEGHLSRVGEATSTGRVVSALETAGVTCHVDLFLSVFATGTRVAVDLARRRGGGSSSVVFCTDATVHARWVAPGVDLYLATCELAARSLRRYDPRAEVVTIPPPVRDEFFQAPTRDEARDRFALPSGATVILLTGGGWGLGPITESARALSAAGHHVLAVSGGNRFLRARLDALARSDPKVRSFGFTREMASLMAAADVVVCGAGQTANEAHVVGRRLVVIDSVPGHGRENLLHEVMGFGAAAVSPSPTSVLDGIALALKSDEEIPPWPVRSAAEWTTLFLRAVEPLGVL